MADSLTAVDDVIQQHLSELALPGVLSVRAGYKFAGGWPVDPPTPAIVVTVAAKTSSPPGGGLLPTSVAGVPVDVRQASQRKHGQLATPDTAAPGLAPDTGGLPMFDDEVVVGDTSRPASTAHAKPPKPQLPYTSADAALEPVTAQLTVQACASPDAGWPVLKAFLASITDTVTIGLYDWTSAHVLDWFTQQLAGKTVSLVLDHPAKNPTADQTDEQTVHTLTSTLQGGLTQAWALERSDPLAAAWLFPSAYHIKVAVADHQRVWLSSGNWNNSNQPDIDPVMNTADGPAARDGDRDWHVVIDSATLATVFETYLTNDLTTAQQHQAQPAPAPAARAWEGPAARVVLPNARTPHFDQFRGPIRVTDTMTITPVLTPDVGSYAPQVRALIASATTTLDMQFQYIELPKDPATQSAAFTDLIAAVVDRQQHGVVVRIIMSEFEVQGYLEKLISAGLDVATSVRIQNNVHNKGVLVDSARVLVSSQNWSNAGVTQNRDAGVIIDNPAIARYFQTIFDHDWNVLANATPAED
ncbi:MAG TPA: phospholipase D-like domain-containing protein [Pseudonocardiaceae bacterium]|jgi:hypothetical protein|nr:phospholipase D-like domain-containing protein [Pseudonocardiaceae bacterium]